uniref:DAGKc domain-containing protein n=1 Tax=Heterorhabditis bacteriophora TaxID=37862 RepID=A0A1I7X1D5_HETBA
MNEEKTNQFRHKNYQCNIQLALELIPDKAMNHDQVLCGLLLRKDRERSLKIPICHIPGGTSNALAASICFACKLCSNTTAVESILVHNILNTMILFSIFYFGNKWKHNLAILLGDKTLYY